MMILSRKQVRTIIMRRLQQLCSWTLSYSIKYAKRRLMLILSCTFLLYFLLKWKLMCSNTQPHIHLQNVCSSYTSGKSVGNLCQDLCQPKVMSSLSCHNFHDERETIFSGTWQNTSVLFKAVKQSSTGTNALHWLDSSNKKIYPSEDDFTQMIKTKVKSKFNLSINNLDAKRMSFIQSSPRIPQRHVEMDNIWSLLQDTEYVASIVYEKFDIFPKLLGSCGSLYAVQKINFVSGFWHLVTLYDSREEWLKRIMISIKILDFVSHLEHGLPEPLHICNVKINNFGISDDFRKIKYLDLNSIHPFSVVNGITGDGSQCKRHSDCDYLDCRSFCNLVTLKCQHGVANNNLQMVCERIFLGWMMSGRVMVPGLLLGPRTPRVLIELLELCANPASEPGTPRAPATDEIRKRLYNLLLHLS